MNYIYFYNFIDFNTVGLVIDLNKIFEKSFFYNLVTSNKVFYNTINL